MIKYPYEAKRYFRQTFYQQFHHPDLPLSFYDIYLYENSEAECSPASGDSGGAANDRKGGQAL